MKGKILNIEDLSKIEEIEHKYLIKYYHFLKFAEDEMFYGFKTKEFIKEDWINFWDDEGISDFAIGAERIVYSILNGKGIGQPNSSPVGSDLFFEVEDAFIHIDLKTVQLENIGDFTNSIFIGKNQNSYKGEIVVNNGKAIREYVPSLPTYYTIHKNGVSKEKICLTYFIIILYDKATLDIKVIAIICMPNGKLQQIYGSKTLKAGKNLDKARFNMKEVNKFTLLNQAPYRIKVVYFDENMDESLKKKLSLYEGIWLKSKS